MPRTDRNKIGKHKTKVYDTPDGFTNVKYHNTVVVSFNKDTIALDTGGYETVTTKVRMNQASHQFSLGFGVYQKDHKWYVTWRGMSIPFEGRSMLLNREDPYGEKKMKIESGKFYKGSDGLIVFIGKEKYSDRSGEHFVAYFKSEGYNRHYREDGTHAYGDENPITKEIDTIVAGKLSEWRVRNPDIINEISEALDKKDKEITLEIGKFKDYEVWQREDGNVRWVHSLSKDNPHKLSSITGDQFSVNIIGHGIEYNGWYIVDGEGHAPNMGFKECLVKKVGIIPRIGRKYRDVSGYIHTIGSAFNSVEHGVYFDTDNGEAPGAEKFNLWEDVTMSYGDMELPRVEANTKPEFDLDAVAKIMAEIELSNKKRSA